ncbi:MAG: hypothetical protein ABSH53_05510 [Holophaga sp.]|jgi:hypothetical protein
MARILAWTTGATAREDPVLARTPLIVLHHPQDREAADRMGRWEEVRLMEKPLRVRRLLDAVIPHRVRDPNESYRMIRPSAS